MSGKERGVRRLPAATTAECYEMNGRYGAINGIPTGRYRVPAATLKRYLEGLWGGCLATHGGTPAWFIAFGGKEGAREIVREYLEG